ncbi:otogelin [Mixophyes fleayi]|uniref:otogelin n=1 Tax=Mixophyes fleayi TaxID=3061075 RepID=UPI003F4D8A94
MEMPNPVILLIVLLTSSWVRAVSLPDFLSAVTPDPRYSADSPTDRNNSPAILQKADPTSQGNQESRTSSRLQAEQLSAVERRIPKVKCEVLPCFNGGECLQKKFCDCSRYNASGSRCQIVYNTGAERENICRTWGQYHFETFDGVYYFYPGKFTYDLLRQNEPDEQSFAIQVHNDPDCATLPYACSRSVSLYFAGLGEIKLQNQIVLYNNLRIQLPHTVGNVKIERISGYVIVRQQYVFSLAWDSSSSVYLKMSLDYVGRTRGLCGNNNWIPQDDLVTSYGKLTENIEEFVNSWREDMPQKSSIHPSNPLVYEPPCAKQSPHTKQMAHSMCSSLLQFPFQSCHELVSPFPSMASCTSDLCVSDGDVGTWCSALTEYARICAHAGHPLHGWRAMYKQCEIPCAAGLVYNDCIDCCPTSCHQRKACMESEIPCVDGCYCPAGLIFENDTCVNPTECPCDFLGTPYQAGSVVRDQCNNCTCSGGKWICTNLTCPAECSVTGDFHIMTFDGRKYTFQAPCQYILAKSLTSGTFTVSLQNAPCGQNLDGSCIQSVNIIINQDQRKQVTLVQSGDVLVYDQYKINLPYTDDVFEVRKLSSVFVQVKTEIGLRLLYDKESLRLYLHLDGRWKDDTTGLCGTFNDNAQDDFLSPAGVPESTPQLFGNSWKTSSACGMEYLASPLDPCDIHLQAASYASESCSIVTKDLFAPCHPYLNPVSYYEQCRRDTCKCGEACLCSALAHYAHQCRRFGIIINFRASFPDCEITCKESMVYGTCVSMCAQTCQSLSALEVCDGDCVEGCACPQGMYLNTQLERCVERNQCPCYLQGIDYHPGENIITSLGKCICNDGIMNCESRETAHDCPAGQIYYNCSSSDVDIELSRERTCENQLLNVTLSAHLPCVSGCVCPKGLVKHGNECFEPDACPCSWKAKEYYPGDIVNGSCHTCVCHHGSFQCTLHPCPSMCTYYGDRHYRTFDGLAFDFVGACKVHLIKSLSLDSLSVTVENVNCYNTGTICRKLISINVGQSLIIFDDDTGNPSPSSIIDKRQEIHIWQAGFFTFLHFSAEYITLLWDQRTTIHVQVGPQWQGELSGLCGNFDLKTVNEMRSPDNFELTNPQEFGSSWAAVQCVDSPDTRNPCTMNPLREPFAKKECGILLSEVFDACHPVVDVTWFYSNCLSDTCGCNRGGDCECFCSSVSAYAHQCCQQGVTVDWRSPRVCPYDCEFYNKILGKGPYRLLSYVDRHLVFSVSLSDATLMAMRGDREIPGHTANFMLTPGLYKRKAHDRNLVSFELADRPNFFLHVGRNRTLMVSKWQRSEEFQIRSTFIIHKNTWISGYSAYESFAKPGYFVQISTSFIYLSKYHHSAQYRLSTLFMLSDAKSRVILRSTCEWRYDACASACFRTCRDPEGEHCQNVPKVEGCFPLCPPDMVLDEVTRKCVYFPDCIEPAIELTTVLSTTGHHKLTTSLNVTTSPSFTATPLSVTKPEVTLHKVSGVPMTANASTYSPKSAVTLYTTLEPATTMLAMTDMVYTQPVPATTITSNITGSQTLLEGSGTTLHLSTLTVVPTPTGPETTSVTVLETSQLPVTGTVSSRSTSATAGPSSAATVILTTGLADGTTAAAFPPPVTVILTTESVTSTSPAQTEVTTVSAKYTPGTGSVPATTESHRKFQTSSTSFFHPITGRSTTSTGHTFSQLALAVSHTPPEITPSATPTIYSLFFSPVVEVTSIPSTSSAVETTKHTEYTSQSTTQMVTLKTDTVKQFVTKVSPTQYSIEPTTKPILAPEMSSIMIQRSTITEATSRPPSVDTTLANGTIPLATTYLTTVSTLPIIVNISGTTLSTFTLYPLQPTPYTITSKYLTKSTQPSFPLVSETSALKTAIDVTSTAPILTSQTSLFTFTAKSEPTKWTLSTSSGTAPHTTAQVSLSTSSGDISHLATKPHVTKDEATLQTSEVGTPMSTSQLVKTNLTTKMVSSNLTSAAEHVSPKGVTQEATKTTELVTRRPRTEGRNTTEFTTFVQDLGNMTGSLKSIPYTGRTLLPTDVSVHATTLPPVHAYSPESVSQRTSQTEVTQTTLIKTSTALSTKNVTVMSVLSPTPQPPSLETSISMTVLTSEYPFTDISKTMPSTSQRTYSTLSTSLSPAVSFSTAPLIMSLATEGRTLLTDTISTTQIPSAASVISTRSTPIGQPTKLSFQFSTYVTSKVTDTGGKQPTEKTETLFTSKKSTTELRALSTPEAYKTTGQLMSASQPGTQSVAISETLATAQPTAKELTSLGSVTEETRTSAGTITRDTVSGKPPWPSLSTTMYPSIITHSVTTSFGHLMSQTSARSEATPEITQELKTVGKMVSLETFPTSVRTTNYSTTTEALQTVIPQTHRLTTITLHATDKVPVTSVPLTHRVHVPVTPIHILTTSLQPRLQSTTEQISSHSPSTGITLSRPVEETFYPADQTSPGDISRRMTVSAMLPSREYATLQICTPYAENECIKHICVDGQLIQVNKSQHCPYNVTQPSCGLLGFAVQINGDRCCPKWECACRCSIFSDLSFVTFDGRYLALFKEASYIVTLTEEESITVQVSKCEHADPVNVSDVTLCLSLLELTYLSNQIIIDRLSRKVAVNSRKAWPMVRKYGYKIVDTGNMYLIDTPSNVKIQWFHSTGLMIIESNSTSKPTAMGLCGFCDGNATNDLILPNGRVLTKSDDSSEFLDSWQVPYTLKYVGKERHQDLNCSVMDCSECFGMILKQTFSSCHPYVSPETFCELWVQDIEYIQDPCKALTAYTSMCHKFNVCIEWRKPDYCPFNCPESLMYRACLPVCDVPQTCQNNEIDLYDTESCSTLTEGCVCAEGSVLHRPYSTMCVPESKCVCTDSAGTPREMGEIWNTSGTGCCMYKCMDNDTIIPVQYNCSDTPEPQCQRYGEVVVSVSDKQSCCPHKLCVCNQTLCDGVIPTCHGRQKFIAYYQNDSCCPRYTCECDPDNCDPVDTRPQCREDQTLIVAHVNNSCCVRHFCGCNVCSQRIPTCQEGETLTVTSNITERCCPTYHCMCDRARCPEMTCDRGMSVMEMWTLNSCCPYKTCECSCEKIPKPECNLGEKLEIDEEFLNSAANPCNCTVYKCVKDTVCLSKERGVLRPGQTIVEHTPQGVCHSSHCTSVMDPVTRFHQINISSLNCAARCQPNQMYEPPREVSRCCGHCRNVSCVQTLLNGTILTHMPGSSWISRCVRYDCTITPVGPVLVTSAINCPPFNETECVKMGGYIVSFLDGCCKTCKEDGKFCKRVTVRMTIRKNDCRSNTPVNIVSCDGKCPSASIYNYNINTYARFCKCCRELGLQRRVVQLYCSGNSTWVNYSIQEPTDCSCQWS